MGRKAGGKEGNQEHLTSLFMLCEVKRYWPELTKFTYTMESNRVAMEEVKMF